MKKKNKAIFLDRDGTIIIDADYLHKIKDVKFYKNTFYALKEMMNKGYILIIVSNQSGIGRGYYTEEDYYKIENYINKKFNQKKIKIAKSYFSPYYENSQNPEYRKKKNFRKPDAGMLLCARKELNIDFKKSFIIGDKLIDMETGKKVGCKTILVLTGKGKKELKNISSIRPDFICNDLKSALKYL